MKITLAQLNPTIGDIDGNIKLLKAAILRANRDKSDLIIFSELFVTGYPPRDLLEKIDFVNKTRKSLQTIITLSKQYPRLGILVGTITPTKLNQGNKLYNSAILLLNGKILGQENKALLPNYDVFDEERYFESDPRIKIINFKQEKLGVSVCEDMWNYYDPTLKHYKIDPIDKLVKRGATILINLSGSPFFIGKERLRYQIIIHHAKKYHLPFIYVNQVGANDELVFDGHSIAVNQNGEVIAALPGFVSKISTIDLKTKIIKKINYQPEADIKSAYEALVLGIKDYFRKTGYHKAILGLSGGIDSALTCCLAAAALGKKNVLGITMPSMFSSKGSVNYSEKLAKNLGVTIKTIPIKKIYDSYLAELKPHFANKPFDTTEENIQARIRGHILMAMSNKFNYLLLSTGNKSEMAVGYCTLYGDMSGGLSAISDVPKTMVYKIAEYINRHKEIIPIETIKIPPSAELRPNQKDQDSLPPYEILDKILELYVDRNCTYQEMINYGLDPATIKWVINKVNRNEYKRKQAAPGIKITSKAFGVGRRMPIAAKYDFLKY